MQSTSKKRLRVETLESRRVLTTIDLAAIVAGDGTDGFMLADASSDGTGSFVGFAGDLNADGIDDFIVDNHVVFGQSNDFGAFLDLESLDGTNGFATNSHMRLGGAGDFNNDGIDDLVVGSDAEGGTNTALHHGSAFVLYGKSSGFSPSVDLYEVNGDAGFRVDAEVWEMHFGSQVSGRGDVNNDGIDDIVIGAGGLVPYHDGSVHVLYGSNSPPTETTLLSQMNRLDFFDGIEVFGGLGWANVHIDGDVNGDGLEDLLTASPDPISGENSTLILLHGRRTGEYPANADAMTSEDGAQIVSGRDVGWRNSYVGDMNGDGFDDVVFGDQGIANEAYVLFGSANGIPDQFDLQQLNGTNGFIVRGAGPDDSLGFDVSSAGDFNGDGFDDLMVSAPATDDVGEVYVLFGKADGYAGSVDISNLDGTDGLTIRGAALMDFTGAYTSNAGDINADGFDDIVIGATGMAANGMAPDGRAFVVYGRVTNPVAGDFNSDGSLDGVDIDALQANIVTGPQDPSTFDLNGDGVVDVLDRDLWLDLAGDANLGPGLSYLVGDANLDGIVDGLDFTDWNAHKFTNSSNWTDGDFTVNGVVDGLDFIDWNTNKFTQSSTAWTLTNKVYSGRSLDESGGEAVLSLDGAVWDVLASTSGVLIRNQATGNYLTADNWNVVLSPTATADSYWQVVRNGDGSIGLRSATTGRYLDGDGPNGGFEVDLSQELLQDDRWLVDVVPQSGSVFFDSMMEVDKERDETVRDAWFAALR